MSSEDWGQTDVQSYHRSSLFASYGVTIGYHPLICSDLMISYDLLISYDPVVSYYLMISFDLQGLTVL